MTNFFLKILMGLFNTHNQNYQKLSLKLQHQSSRNCNPTNPPYNTPDHRQLEHNQITDDLKEIYGHKPLIAYRRQSNLRDIIISTVALYPPTQTDPNQRSFIPLCIR